MNNQATRTWTTPISYAAFVGLGLTSGLLGLAWPSMQKEFGLPLDGVSVLYLLQTAGYTLASFSIGRLMSRWGSATTLLIGASGTALCMLGIAFSSTWVAIAGIALVSGLVTGIVDAGLNLYVAAYHSARQMNWLHASFGIGITFGPLVMTIVLERNWGWQAGYGFVGLLIIPVALLIALSRAQWRTEGFQTAESKPVQRAGFGESLKVPAVWWSMLTFVVYVGTEIGIGQWAFVLLTQSRGMGAGIAGPWTSAYWGAFTGGRILFGLIANRFQTKHVLRFAMALMVLGAVFFWWNPTELVGLVGLVLVGFAQAPVFPMMMSDTANRVGTEHAENTVSLQMGAVGIGTAILPGMIGMLGNSYGLESMSASFVVFAALVLMAHELTRIRPLAQPTPSPSTD